MHPPLERIRALFEARFGAPPEDWRPVSADGSARRYWRLTGADGVTAIGGCGPEPEENRAFLSFSRAFRSIDLPVPELYAADEETGVWLEEDLGDETLFDVLSAARREEFPSEVLPLYRRVLEILPRFQVRGAEVVDFGLAYPHVAFDRQSILWDLNYFKYHFLKLARIPFHEAHLEKDFRRLVRFLLKADAEYFLYRDFQSRNVMVRDGEPWFIDYQGGRRGALAYDVASLLYDAKADLPDSVREALLDHYLEALSGLLELDRAAFLERYPGFVLVRLMQAMGAYGYRGFFERKPHFLQSVPYAARTLGGLLDAGLPRKLPELEATFRRIVERWAERSAEEWRTWPELASESGPVGADFETRPSPLEPPASGRAKLTLHVGSFAFRGGYPDDPSGHGGGFIFDCRSLPNPGREVAFRDLSGLDPRVVAYLEACPEVQTFWEHVCPLVEAQLREFLRRGFSNLSVRFGCTGGQHRSVYFAERLARHIRTVYPDVEVDVSHREREVWAGPWRG